jgi:hypothetical protein
MYDSPEKTNNFWIRQKAENASLQSGTTQISRKNLKSGKFCPDGSETGD